MLEFTFKTRAEQGLCLPEIRINQLPNTIVIPDGEGSVTFTVDDEQTLVLDFFNKTELDTVVENNRIIKDCYWRIDTVWCDGIRLEPWFYNNSVYCPRYFTGFLQLFPDSPASVVAAYQFNFPGTVTWTWQDNFWDWYFVEKNKREVINFIGQDPDRVWKFRGSLDPCNDLVEKIKNLIQS